MGGEEGWDLAQPRRDGAPAPPRRDGSAAVRSAGVAPHTCGFKPRHEEGCHLGRQLRIAQRLARGRVLRRVGGRRRPSGAIHIYCPGPWCTCGARHWRRLPVWSHCTRVFTCSRARQTRREVSPAASAAARSVARTPAARRAHSACAERRLRLKAAASLWVEWGGVGLEGGHVGMAGTQHASAGTSLGAHHTAAGLPNGPAMASAPEPGRQRVRHCAQRVERPLRKLGQQRRQELMGGRVDGWKGRPSSNSTLEASQLGGADQDEGEHAGASPGLPALPAPSPARACSTSQGP